jgi:Fic family protein
MILSDKTYFNQFQKATGENIKQYIQHFDFAGQNLDLDYQTQASAVYSSNIEGNSIDLNSFMNYKLSKDKPKPQKELQEIEDLIKAYEFAQTEILNEKNLLKAHKILSKKLVIPGLRGKYRNDKVGVFGQSGLVYLAIEEKFVGNTMKEFLSEIVALTKRKLTEEESFYFASFIHLRFVHIHPFRDGNGRAARLLEKWFLAKTLGDNFWKISSEKYYKEHQADYYKNINLGVNFYELDYSKCLPFLIMLPNCLK